jgi:hypothetical protein
MENNVCNSLKYDKLNITNEKISFPIAIECYYKDILSENINQQK